MKQNAFHTSKSLKDFILSGVEKTLGMENIKRNGFQIRGIRYTGFYKKYSFLYILVPNNHQLVII